MYTFYCTASAYYFTTLDRAIDKFYLITINIMKRVQLSIVKTSTLHNTNDLMNITIFSIIMSNNHDLLSASNVLVLSELCSRRNFPFVLIRTPRNEIRYSWNRLCLIGRSQMYNIIICHLECTEKSA